MLVAITELHTANCNTATLQKISKSQNLPPKNCSHLQIYLAACMFWQKHRKHIHMPKKLKITTKRLQWHELCCSEMPVF